MKGKGKVDRDTAWTHQIGSDNEELRFVKQMQWQGITSTALLYGAIGYLHTQSVSQLILIVALCLVCFSALGFHAATRSQIGRRRKGQTAAMAMMPHEILDLHTKRSRVRQWIEDAFVNGPFLLVTLGGGFLTLLLLCIAPPKATGSGHAPQSCPETKAPHSFGAGSKLEGFTKSEARSMTVPTANPLAPWSASHR